MKIKLEERTLGKKSSNYGKAYPCIIVTKDNLKDVIKECSELFLIKHLNQVFSKLCQELYLDNLDEMTNMFDKKSFMKELETKLHWTEEHEKAYRKTQSIWMKERFAARNNEKSRQEQRQAVINKLTPEERKLLGL